jgi:hypothetical protein
MRNFGLIASLLVATVLGVASIGCHHSDDHPYRERKETDVIRGKQPAARIITPPATGNGTTEA